MTTRRHVARALLYLALRINAFSAWLLEVADRLYPTPPPPPPPDNVAVRIVSLPRAQQVAYHVGAAMHVSLGRNQVGAA